MREFTKAGEPQAFIDWQQSGNDEWTPSYADLRGEDRRSLHDSLLGEQSGLCCYCGRSVDRSDSHIEHFRPQASYPELSLDYANLHASCVKGAKPRAPLHCGHAKGSLFDEILAIAPVAAGCSERFVYALNGAISQRSDDDHSARYMIDLLKLDIPFLRASREEALAGLFDNDFLGEATAGDLEKLIAQYALPGDDGRLPSLGHVIVGFAKRLLGRI